MTQDQQTNEQQPKPKPHFLFAAMMGIAAAVASFALGIISTIPGMKWLSAVSLSTSHALDWRLGLLNTYAAMHVKLVGSGMIDSGLGAEKVSASILLPPGLLTVGIGLCLVVAAIIVRRMVGPSLRQSIRAGLLVALVLVVVMVAFSPLVRAKLDTIALPSTDEISFSPPAIEYGPNTLYALGSCALLAIPLFCLVCGATSPRSYREPDEGHHDVSSLVAGIHAAIICLLAVGVGVVLGHGGVARSGNTESGETKSRIANVIVPATTAAYLVLTGCDLHSTAEGIYLPTGEEARILDASAGLSMGVRVVTNNGEDEKTTPIPGHAVWWVILAWGIVYFIVGRFLTKPDDVLKGVVVGFHALVILITGIMLHTQLVRIDGGAAKSVVTISASVAWTSFTIMMIALAVPALGAASARFSRRGKQPA